MQSFHSDLLFSINLHLNHVDRSLLKSTCKRLYVYFHSIPKIKNLDDLFIYGSLEWIQRKKIWPTVDQVNLLALNGHLKVLKWTRLNGSVHLPWNEWTCSNAAENGHLDVLKWARLNGCPWHDSTCQYAAKNGHLEVLKWARQNGCPWDKTNCLRYANTKEIKEWINSN
jgi:hypothetical protein